MRGGRSVVLGGLLACALLVPAAPADALPFIAAHRGGAYVDGKARFPENTMPAFRYHGRRGFILELDVKRTADDQLVVFHDATLDRVTPCTGLVRDKTLAGLRKCPVDVLGSPGSDLDPAPPFTANRRRTPIPTLAEVLAYARKHRLWIAPEIKNQPTDADFDPTTGYATQVVQALIDSRFPPSRMLIQSFWPTNLTVAEQMLPEADTVLLTLKAMNEGSPTFAAANDFEWVGPEFAGGFTNPQFASTAHNQGRQVITYTPNTEAELAKAHEQDVDAVFTDDPALARRVFRRLGPDRPEVPDAPSRSDCRDARAHRTLAPIESLDPEPGAPRVFAVQFKQETRHVESYAAFRTKIECVIRDWVVPRLAEGRPNVVAFTEDVGLATIATGPRGAAAREVFANPENQPSCESEGAPCATLAAYEAIGAAYAPQVTAYRSRFPDMPPVSQNFVAATDTFARGWMQVFSDMARRYGVYILGSNNQSPFRESTDPSEIALFAEPGTSPESVFVATEPKVYNEVFMWGPHTVRREGPAPLRNVVAQNKKVPLTALELQLQIDEGPASGPDAIENVRPYRLPGTKAKVGFATSLPAFKFGDPEPGRECDDLRETYMRCMDRLGVNLVMQDEANPGRWAHESGCGGNCWQPLEWMTSSSRQMLDPTVSFAYNVTPSLVGNLADLPFDLQSSISQRGSHRSPRSGCYYVGNSEAQPEDPDGLRRYAGRRREEFLVLAPWVVSDRPRPELRDVADRLAPGSGDELENDYLETVLIADLPFPPRPSRRCRTVPAERAKLRGEDGQTQRRSERASRGEDEAPAGDDEAPSGGAGA